MQLVHVLWCTLKSSATYFHNTRQCCVNGYYTVLFRKPWPKSLRAQYKCNFLKRSIFIYVCVCHMCTGAFRDQRRRMGPPEPVLQVVVSRQVGCWEWKSGSLKVLPHWAISSAQDATPFIFIFQILSICVGWTHEYRTYVYGRLIAYHNITRMCPALGSSMAILWPVSGLVIWS